MAVCKCKMCGGDITLNEDKTYGTCEFCGSTMTLPKAGDEQRLATFNRGNQFRRAGEFDKAVALYEQLIREDDTDAEAHWCCALSRFGIEYVEDPSTLEYIPTCHRASYENFTEDVDYIAAVENSEGITKKHYQKEGIRISEIQKDILRTSQNEEPFDVFICYKESDEKGHRTVDSTLAQDIYYQLTDEGYRVFFARITLEDKVGTEYEPYIFAALNSAKVMIVVGTSTDNLNAVWVKNEWSRFLVLMKKDRNKLILPCYRDMDPYDMPEALSVLQAYDMSKIGFIQDLVRGIRKVVGEKKEKETAAVQSNSKSNSVSDNTAALIKRGAMALEDGDWQIANQFYEEVLNHNPESAEAYLGKLLADMQVGSVAELQNCQNSFETNRNYIKAVRFGEEKVINELNAALSSAKEKIYSQKYNEAVEKMNSAKTESDYAEALKNFEEIKEYRDAEELGKNCTDKIEECREIKRRLAKKRRRIIAAIISAIIVVSLIILTKVYFMPEVRMQKGMTAYQQEDYDTAIEYFTVVNGYGNSNDWLAASREAKGKALVLEGKNAEAIEVLKAIESGDNINAWLLLAQKNYSYELYRIDKKTEAIAIAKEYGFYSESDYEKNAIKYSVEVDIRNGEYFKAFVDAYTINDIEKCVNIIKDYPQIVGEEIGFLLDKDYDSVLYNALVKCLDDMGENEKDDDINLDMILLSLKDDFVNAGRLANAYDQWKNLQDRNKKAEIAEKTFIGNYDKIVGTDWQCNIVIKGKKAHKYTYDISFSSNATAKMTKSKNSIVEYEIGILNGELMLCSDGVNQGAKKKPLYKIIFVGDEIEIDGDRYSKVN